MNTFNSVQSCVINNSIDIDYSILIPGILNKYTSIWLDASGSTNFDLTGSNVNIWKNKTTNVLNFDLTPNDGTNITYNSTPPSSVLINNGYYLKNDNFNPITSLQTWVFVLSTPTTSVTPDCRIIGVNSGSGFDILIQNGTFLIYKHNTAPNTGINYPISLTANTKYLFSLSLNMSNPDFNSTKNNSIFRFNGSTKTNGNVVNNSNFNISGTSQLLIGTLISGGPFYANNGSLGFNIYEMIGINNKNLGSGEVKIIENYLNKRWKLGLSI